MDRCRSTARTIEPGLYVSVACQLPRGHPGNHLRRPRERQLLTWGDGERALFMRFCMQAIKVIETATLRAKSIMPGDPIESVELPIRTELCILPVAHDGEHKSWDRYIQHLEVQITGKPKIVTIENAFPDAEETSPIPAPKPIQSSKASRRCSRRELLRKMQRR